MDWTISASERALHEKTFAQLKPDKGVVAGSAARECFLKSLLPNDDLAAIWCAQ
jgi:hypothetical protein